jgi:hypothetical protein
VQRSEQAVSRVEFQGRYEFGNSVRALSGSIPRGAEVKLELKLPWVVVEVDMLTALEATIIE